MTYLDDEIAHKLPVELYTFTLPTATERFTDTEIAWAHPISGLPFAPNEISRGNLQQSEEDDSMSIEIVTDALNPVAEFFRTPFLPARTIFVLVERTHTGAIDAPAVVFRGQIAQCVFEGAKAKMTCVPTKRAVSRTIPVILVQNLCTNTLYDQRCLVDPAAFDVAGNITVVSGVNVTVPGHGKPDDYFSGGTLTAPGLPEATIRKQTGNVFSLLYNYGFTVGMAVVLLPGCDKRFSTCIAKFANSTHYQGFPNMPQIDPFVDQMSS